MSKYIVTKSSKFHQHINLERVRTATTKERTIVKYIHGRWLVLNVELTIFFFTISFNFVCNASERQEVWIINCCLNCFNYALKVSLLRNCLAFRIFSTVHNDNDRWLRLLYSSWYKLIFNFVNHPLFRLPSIFLKVSSLIFKKSHLSETWQISPQILPEHFPTRSSPLFIHRNAQR